MKKNLGDIIDTPSATVFFGNKHSTIENLKAEFPEYKFSRIKQTHSDIIVSANSLADQAIGKIIEADAHYTQTRNTALVISTADCLPVMVHVPSSALVMGIHAGWRGIESNIIGKSLMHIKDRGHDISDAQVWIGPHIGFGSFEVSLDVAERLRKTYKELPSLVYGEFEQPQPDPAKKRFNLFLIATLQMVTAGIHEQNIHSLLINTVKSKDHESHRRDGAKATRQLSFISLKPAH